MPTHAQRHWTNRSLVAVVLLGALVAAGLGLGTGGGSPGLRAGSFFGSRGPVVAAPSVPSIRSAGPGRSGHFVTTRVDGLPVPSGTAAVSPPSQPAFPSSRPHTAAAAGHASLAAVRGGGTAAAGTAATSVGDALARTSESRPALDRTFAASGVTDVPSVRAPPARLHA